MSDPNFEPPVNPLPPVILALFLVIVLIEGAFTLGARGFVGGAEAIGWRAEALQRYGFSPRFFDLTIETRRWSADFFIRLVSYPFVHGNFTHAIFAGVMLLALGKMVGDVFGNIATLVVIIASTIGGVVLYGLLLDTPTYVVGAFPPVYGLIGAFTFILFRRLGQMGENQVRAFTLIGFLMFIQLIFGLLFGATSDWVADIAAFAIGFAASIVLSPGGWQRMLDRLRQ